MMLAAVGFLACDPAAASLCAPRAAIKAHLETRFAERATFVAMNDIGVIEVWTNDQTKTWTITHTNLDGVACVVSTGQDFERLTKPAPKING